MTRIFIMVAGMLLCMARPVLSVDQGNTVFENATGVTVEFDNPPSGFYAWSVDVSGMTVVTALDTLEKLGEVRSGSKADVQQWLSDNGYSTSTTMFSNFSIVLDVASGNATVLINGNSHPKTLRSFGDDCMEACGGQCAAYCAGDPNCFRVCMAGCWALCFWLIFVP